MPGYFERKLNALLNAPTVETAPRVKGVHHKYPYIAVSLDPETRTWLLNAAPERYRSRWIDRQARVNATPDCWIDTRPDELRAADRFRLSQGLMPLWTEGTTRCERHTNLTIKPDTIAILANVSDTYGIVPQQYAVYRLFEGIRGVRLGTELSNRSKVAAVLRAWAGGYISPRYSARVEIK